MTAVQMAVVHGRYAITGEGYSTEGQISHVGGQVEGPLDSLLLPMATRPKARWSSSRRRVGSTRP